LSSVATLASGSVVRWASGEDDRALVEESDQRRE
jgi:hypothetical protein